MSRANRTRSALRRRLLVWHYRIGLAASAIVALVVVTGLPLNHADTLGLDRSLIAHDSLRALYGLEPEEEPTGYRVGGGWLVWLDGTLYLDGRRLNEPVPSIRGAVAADGLIVVAAPAELLVLSEKGALVERLRAGAGLPGDIEEIGIGPGGRVMLRTPAGQFASDDALVDWKPSRADAAWARATPLPAGPRAAVLAAYGGGGLPWSRVLLDIHTGRIFGPWGPVVIDAAALALLILVVTGICNWLARDR